MCIRGLGCSPIYKLYKELPELKADEELGIEVHEIEKPKTEQQKKIYQEEPRYYCNSKTRRSLPDAKPKDFIIIRIEASEKKIFLKGSYKVTGSNQAIIYHIISNMPSHFRAVRYYQFKHSFKNICFNFICQTLISQYLMQNFCHYLYLDNSPNYYFNVLLFPPTATYCLLFMFISNIHIYCILL